MTWDKDQDCQWHVTKVKKIKRIPSFHYVRIPTITVEEQLDHLGHGLKTYILMELWGKLHISLHELIKDEGVVKTAYRHFGRSFLELVNSEKPLILMLWNQF